MNELYQKGKEEWLQGKHLDALETYRSITESGHGKCDANMNAAVILAGLGRHKEAEDHFQKAFESCPDDDDLAFNYSLHLLSTGNLKDGLKLYERRSWNIKPPGKEWDGKDCKTLLIVPEQGNGDIIQFARFLPEAKKKCDNMIVMCFSSLVRVIESMGIADQVVELNPGDEFVESEGNGEEEVPYDRFVRIMSIPHLLGITNINSEPYLKSTPELLKKWSSKVSPSQNLKVGLCWRGCKRNKDSSMAIDSRRSVSLETIHPILETKGIDFYSLQKDGKERHEKIIDFMSEAADFADTAALVENLDLVISVDTAVAHISGAVGTPTWILNRKDSCWRWGSEGDSTMWYKKTRLFRQEKMMEWNGVVDQVKNELDRLVSNR